jgi:hypothetical protein
VRREPFAASTRALARAVAVGREMIALIDRGRAD